MFTSLRARRFAYQAAFLTAVIGAVIAVVVVGQTNIAAQGIVTGFGFLERTTGWPVSFSVVDVSARSTYAWVLYVGLLNTIVVGSLTLIGATILGLMLALMRISHNGSLRLVGTSYVEIFRNVPVILQVFFWYAVLTHIPGPKQAFTLADVAFLSNRGLVLPAPNYSGLDLLILAVLIGLLLVGNIRWRERLPAAHRLLGSLAIFVLAAFVLLYSGRGPETPMISIPELRGLRFVDGLSLKPEFSALLIGLVLFGASYIGEIIRGGLLSVSRGRLEAGAALGLSPWQINRLIRIPLALRAMLPALTNQYVWLMKATTVGIAVGFPDYFAIVSTSINQSGQTLELLGLLMLGFLAINYSISFVLNRINARLALRGRN